MIDVDKALAEIHRLDQKVEYLRGQWESQLVAYLKLAHGIPGEKAEGIAKAGIAHAIGVWDRQANE